MCERCDKEVIEMGILDSDLPNLPYKLVNWHCMVADCRCKTKIRDYGIAPLYYWPVKIFRGKNGSWRGGWADCTHGYICSRHFKEYEKDPRAFCRQHQRDHGAMLAKITPIVKSKLHKK